MSAGETSVQERPAPAPVSPPVVRLAEALDRSARAGRPEPRSLLLAGGAVAVGAGVAAIALGWYGAAHSTYLFQQIPYVISGGMLGLALVVAGAALVIGSWVVRLVHEARQATGALQQIARQLAATEDTLSRQGVGGGGASDEG
jgi:hypothetical protein